MSILLIRCFDGSYWYIDEAESILFFNDLTDPVPPGGVVPFRKLNCRGDDLIPPGRPERIDRREKPAPSPHRLFEKRETEIEGVFGND